MNREPDTRHPPAGPPLPPLGAGAPSRHALGSLTLLAGLLTLSALSGCGGGGDSEAAAPSPAPPPVASTPTAPGPGPSPAPPVASPPAPPVASPPAPPVAAPPPSAGTRATCRLADFRAELLQRVNAHRAAGATCGTQTFGATTALAWNDPLTQASLVHSEDMVALNFFSHTGSSGSSAGDRATAAGYAWRTWGENIAAGQTSVAQVVGGWMASPGHCANIMAPAFRDIGVACVEGTASNRYRTYWTMTLGASSR